MENKSVATAIDLEQSDNLLPITMKSRQEVTAGLTITMRKMYRVNVAPNRMRQQEQIGEEQKRAARRK